MMANKENKSHVVKLGLFQAGRTHTCPYMPCPATAITLLLPDTDQVFQNTPTLSKPWPSLHPGCLLRWKVPCVFSFAFNPPLFSKREEKMSLWHASVCSRRPQRQGYLQGFGWMQVRVRACGFLAVCEEERGRKQELDAKRNHPGLSWCEEAGSELGCSTMPKWTISHRPQGLVLIDSGWTGVGGLLVKYILTWVTYCSLSLPKSFDRGLDQIKLNLIFSLNKWI